eukprot:TRINITY_DN14801_c0_g1_i1.p1 TRINITY_DN14801_c0_g1~~TRINITY_DN14801_c0_g1_i1.p1  ORF type:complete len:165 (+),score=5.36 TRINITY_DN14801_c0_g1_i1:63-497(+)
MQKLLAVLIVFLCCFSSALSSQSTCSTFLTNRTFAWMAVYDNYASAGTASYFSNGTFVTYIGGIVANNGTYSITEKDGWCYELEKYTFPPGSTDTCNTFKICEDTLSIIGCEVFSDKCFASCETEKEWANWYTARVLATNETNS